MDLHARIPLERRGRDVVVVAHAHDGRIGIESRQYRIGDHALHAGAPSGMRSCQPRVSSIELQADEHQQCGDDGTAGKGHHDAGEGPVSLLDIGLVAEPGQHDGRSTNAAKGIAQLEHEQMPAAEHRHGALAHRPHPEVDGVRHGGEQHRDEHHVEEIGEHEDDQRREHRIARNQEQQHVHHDRAHQCHLHHVHLAHPSDQDSWRRPPRPRRPAWSCSGRRTTCEDGLPMNQASQAGRWSVIR